ncbi:FecR domain-containing protein [Hydrogenophaga taeniospiralis]|uniref:FecR family protein n=1 Tax=Hydrogenophaga taeniospiralis TaxID=65656 RepID=UPI001CFA70E3|nr:FecR domain-containing protein [Hydrogenophaga taeniospiralis]MCB4366961.1 FecR domain-containing protein [Hydrogenophaga taeniospiralis]
MSTPQPARTPAARSTEPDDAALDWFVRCAGGLLGSADEAAFQSWLAADAAHAAAFARHRDNWCLLDALPAEGVRMLKQNLADDKAAAARAAPRQRAWWRDGSSWVPQGALAAVALMVSCGGGYLAWEHGQQQPVYTQRFATERGQQLDVVLPEGSRLRLDTFSQADVTMYLDRREVRLPQGQAAFQVQGDPARPFDVLAGPLRITVVGTRFAVRYTPGVPGRAGVHVAVEEGHVRVARAERSAAGDAAVELVAGQQITSDMAGLLGTVSAVPAAGIAPWRESRVSFDDTPLDQALAEFGRYGPVPLTVREPAVAALRVTGTFDPRRLDNFSRLLPQVLPVRLRERGGEVEIVSAGH